LGIALLQEGLSVEAQTHFQKALQIDPPYAAAGEAIARLQNKEP